MLIYGMCGRYDVYAVYAAHAVYAVYTVYTVYAVYAVLTNRNGHHTDGVHVHVCASQPVLSGLA